MHALEIRRRGVHGILGIGVYVCEAEDVPGKHHVAGRNIGRDGKGKGLAVCSLAALAVRAVAVVGGGDLEGLAGVDGEADLAGAAPVVADAGQAVDSRQPCLTVLGTVAVLVERT